MQIFISSIENHTKNLDVLMILNLKNIDKHIIISTVTATATVNSTITPTISSTITKTTQENTNKSEYAFKKSLNSLLSSNKDGTNFKQEKPVKSSETYQLLLLFTHRKLKPLLLQSIDESDKQSGIVSDIILIVSDNSTTRNSFAKYSVDCKTYVAIVKEQQRLIWSLAEQNYALIDHWPKEALICYTTEMKAKNGNSTHFDHLMKNTMNDNDTVNMICDSNVYLIKVNTNHSIVIDGCSSLICNDQNLVIKNDNDEAMADYSNHADTSEQAKRTSKLVSTYIKFDDLIRMKEWEKKVNQAGMKPRMRLCGGGEDSITNGTNAWGAPATSNPGNSWGTVNPQQSGVWGNNPQVGPGSSGSNLKQQPPQQPGSTGATGASGGVIGADNGEPNAWAGGNPVNPTSNNAQNQSASANNASNSNNNNSANSIQAQQQQQPSQPPQAETPAVQPNPKLERLNTMIEALHSLDGWGSENVNQDSRWDVPASPEPGSKPDPNSATSGPHAGIPMWKTNTGTEIWEANLRNGGQMPQQAPVQKTPWGPSTNIGGTWGEDDDANEPGAVWNGAAGVNQAATTTQGGPSQQPPWNAGNMWGPGGVAPGVIKKDNEWGGAAGPTGGWDQRNVPPLGAPSSNAGMDPTNVDLRNMRIAGAMDNNREIRGDPRGISGRLNGNVNLWEQHQLPGMAPNKIPQATTPNTPSAGPPQWPSGQLPAHNKISTGWDDSSTSGVRRNVDDGTALWGQTSLSRQNSNVSNWKEGPDGLQRNSQQRNSIVAGNLPGPTGNRLGNAGPIKPDNLWGQNNAVGRGGSGWEESSGNNWDDKNSGSLWNDNASSAGWSKTKPMGSNWNDPSSEMTSEWGMHNNVMNKPPNKINPLEIIRSSKHYRMLCEMGFKKEEVETVLRICNMNLEESIEMLQRNGSSSDWRRQDDHGPGFGGQFGDRFSSGGNSTLPFSQTNQNPLSGFGGPNINSFNNMKFGAGHGGPNGITNGPFGQPPSALNQNAQSQPSTQQLRMLVQQIQMAVQHGYLNHQILNQPLAPQTLLLLNQMLNHIKQLQVMQSNLNRSGGGGANAVQISLAINKLKSQIGNLQSQITAQQTIYVKQQQQQNNPSAVPGGGHPANDIFRTPNDLSGLPGTFSDMSLKDSGAPFPTSTGSTSQQSRLNQWKLPAPTAADKDSDLTDFPRAPGTNSKSTGLGVMDDGTWSNGRTNTGDGWPDSNAHDNKDWAGNADAFTDLVPEFEPGKPWKGTQTTRIEDDPTITPGSVARSPLSIAAAKESNLFANSNSNNNINNNATNSKSSPTESISSSTWSYNPNNGHGGFGGSKLSKNPWPDSIVPPADLWDNPLGKGRVGPPGLKTAGSKLDSNGWSSHSAGAAGAAGWNGGAATWSSSWILLKNLSAQIDGPTLRTLCIQHGPLLAFHLYLNHGIALCKYSTREEANKAQMALNNCMLSSTTICAETPTESDVQNILQHLGPPSGSNGITGSQSGGQNWRLGAAAQSQSVRTPAADTWGSAWPSTGAGSNLWGPLEGPSDRATPANLNSYLPESLLGTDLN